MGDRIEGMRVNRRRFLRIVGFSTGGAALAPWISGFRPVDDEPRLARPSRFYRAAQGGRLLGSADGMNWNEVANFGPHLALSEVKLAPDAWVEVTLALGPHAFTLRSRDEKTWYTSGYDAPGQV